MSADDRIIDGSTTDNDVLNITATADPAVMDVSNIENINIDWNSVSTPDIDLSNVTGATVAITSSKSGYLGNVNLTDVGENNIVTGAGVTGTLTIDGIEDATVTSTLADEIDIGDTTAADGVITVVAGAATTVSIDGGDDVVLTALLADTISLDDGTFDTATLTLGVDADVTVTGATDSVVTIGTDEDITVTIAAASVYEELTVGGDGTVTLVIDAVADLDGLTITNTNGDVELDAALTTADFSSVSAENIISTTAAAGVVVLTIASGQSFVLQDVGVNPNDVTFEITADDDSTADSVTITLEDDQAQALIFDIGDKEVETVNIVIDANDDFDDTADFTIADLQGNSAVDTVFVITSSDADVEVLVSAADASIIDASAIEGDFTLTTQTSDEELTIEGAVGDNDVTFFGTTTDSAYVGQDGDDTVTFATTTGTATAILGAGDNTVTAAAAISGAGSLAVLTGAGDNTITADLLTSGTLDVTSGAGDDVVSATGVTSGEVTLELGAGDNEITLGTDLAAAEISITTGAGDDTITMDGDAADAADITIALGAGTNRLILEADADLTDYTLTMTGLSEIELATADAAVFTAGAFTTGGAVIDSELLDGASIEILSSAAAGTAAALLGVELADGTTSFDGSSLTISDSISEAALGLNIGYVTAADDFTIIGSEGDDTITTGTGDDTITGGEGADTIDGGTGDNTFVFADGDGSLTVIDSIAAFVTGTDELSLGVAGSNSNFSADTTTYATGTLALAAANILLDGTVQYVFTNDITNASDIAPNAGDGLLFVDYDLDGTADQIIALISLQTAGDLIASDIVA